MGGDLSMGGDPLFDRLPIEQAESEEGRTQGLHACGRHYRPRGILAVRWPGRGSSHPLGAGKRADRKGLGHESDSNAYSVAANRSAARSNGLAGIGTDAVRTDAACNAGKRPLYLHVVIHPEFKGMRAKPKGVVFLLLHLRPVRDEIGIEDIATEQERVIGLKSFNRTA